MPDRPNILSDTAALRDVDEGWFCIRSLVKHEHIAASSLRQIDGAEVYLPRLRYRKLTRRGPVWFTEALFPNYLFARFDAAAHLRHVRSLNGVQTIVQFGGSPARVPAEVIEELRRHTGSEEICELSEELHEGDAVRIATGAFHGLQAVVTRVMPARDRVRVLLEFLGRATEVEVARAGVVAEMANPLACK
jgi:transcriptional antiterminator RfaH